MIHHHPFSRRRALAVAAACLLPSCNRKPAQPAGQMIQLTGFTMGGNWSVKLPAAPARVTAGEVREQIQQLLDHLDAELSLYRDDSSICRFNRSGATGWFDVPAEVAEIVDRSIAISQATDGAFDITVAPLVALWGFAPPGSARDAFPTDAAIARAQETVGFQRLHVRHAPPAMRKDNPATAIDLGAIGKGYAADRVASLLQQLTLGDFLVDIGGELLARGRALNGIRWQVGIQTPTPDVRRILRTLQLREMAIATSGDYRNFREIGGKRICHEIDPRTGRPAANPPASVSVLHTSAASADALATALMVLSLEAGLPLAEQLGVAAMFVVRGNGQFEQVESARFRALSAESGPTPAHGDISG